MTTTDSIARTLSEIKRLAVRTDLKVWPISPMPTYSKSLSPPVSQPVSCICITEDALIEALKEVLEI